MQFAKSGFSVAKHHKVAPVAMSVSVVDLEKNSAHLNKPIKAHNQKYNSIKL